MYKLKWIAACIWSSSLLGQSINISCDPFYNVFTNCQLSTSPLLSQPYSIQLDGESEFVETRFTFEYQFNCEDRYMELNWTAGEGLQKVLTSKDWKKASLLGRQDLHAVQSEQSKKQADGYFHNEPCRLEIRRIEAAPSKTTVQSWRKLFIEFSDRLEEAHQSLAVVQRLTDLKYLYDYLEELNGLLFDELSNTKRHDLYLKSKTMIPVLEALAQSSRDEEQNSIIKIIEVLQTLNNGNAWVKGNGEAYTLDDFLTEDQKKVLRHQPENYFEDQEKRKFRLFYKISQWNEKVKSLHELLELWGGS